MSQRFVIHVVFGAVLLALASGQGCPSSGLNLDLGALLDTGSDTDADTGEPSQSMTDFEHVWTDFSEHYSHFAAKGVDWDEVRSVYEADFEDELAPSEFLSRMASVLAELQDLHVYLLDASGTPVSVYERLAEQNYLADYLPLYFPDGIVRLGSFPLRYGWMDGNIGYISIESFSGEAWDGLRTSDLDALFAQFAEADGMIVDIRRNNGGSEDVARAIASHFAAHAFAYGMTETRVPGSDRDAFEMPVPHVLDPAENAPFHQSVVLLMGQANMSSAEWFILMMRGTGTVTLMGDVSRGSSGNPQEFSLANGVRYGIPTWIAYDADMNPIEDVGIEPDVAIAPDLSYDEQRDYVIEEAWSTLTSDESAHFD